MNTQDSAIEPSQPSRFWLVGLRLDPNFPNPDFYTLLRDDPAYWPIMYQGQIIFFHDVGMAQEALDFYLHHLSLPPSHAPTEPTLILDFAQALYLLSKESLDETSCLLNIINTLLDMLKAASVELPAMYRADLHEIADHLTFSKEFESFLKDQQLERAEVIEALQWALGAVLTKAMFFPKPNIKP
jgi:hypothetical protein